MVFQRNAYNACSFYAMVCILLVTSRNVEGLVDQAIIYRSSGLAKIYGRFPVLIGAVYVNFCGRESDKHSNARIEHLYG